MSDYGIKFENAIKNIFGKPKTSVYFSSYFDQSKHRPILYTACLYSLNYIPEKFKDDEIKLIENYMNDFPTEDIDKDKQLIDLFNNINS